MMTIMTATLMSDLMKMLRVDEGLKLRPYVDTVGKLSIGYGRNLSDVGISEAEASILANNDLHYHCDFLNRTYIWFHDLEEPRKAALVNMCYNLGTKGFSEFKKMIDAFAHKEYKSAAFYALESKWADQVGARAKRISYIIREGKYPDEVKLESL